MPVVVKSRTREPVDTPLGVSGYVYLVDGLNPNEPVNHRVSVPLRAIQERKEREAIPACDACRATGLVIHVPTAEIAEPPHAAHRYRSRHRHPAADVCGDDCVVTSTCTCGACACCIQSLSVIFEECLVAQQPDELMTLPAARQRRCIAVGAAPEYQWDEPGSRPVRKTDRAADAMNNQIAQDLRIGKELPRP